MFGRHELKGTKDITREATCSVVMNSKEEGRNQARVSSRLDTRIGRLKDCTRVDRSCRMGTGLRWALLILGALGVIGTATGETGGDDVKCAALGFTGLALCSDCDSLAKYVNDQELESDCRKCCAQESEDSISKATYAGAMLEVCPRKLQYYPNIQSIVEGKLSAFPSVEVQYRYGSPPKLIMMDRDGNFKETIRIDNWKSEHIEQFLKEKVRP